MYMHYFTIGSYFQTKPFADCIFPLQHRFMFALVVPIYSAASLQVLHECNLFP